MSDLIDRLHYATIDPVTKQRLDSGVYGHAPIEDLEEAVDELRAKDAEIERLRKSLSEADRLWIQAKPIIDAVRGYLQNRDPITGSIASLRKALAQYDKEKNNET